VVEKAFVGSKENGLGLRKGGLETNSRRRARDTPKALGLSTNVKGPGGKGFSGVIVLQRLGGLQGPWAFGRGIRYRSEDPSDL